MSATARGRSGQPRRGGLDYLNGLIRASAYIQSFTAVPAHWRHSGGLIEYPLSTHGGNSNGYKCQGGIAAAPVKSASAILCWHVDGERAKILKNHNAKT
jgi:hypothetical protein